MVRALGELSIELYSHTDIQQASLTLSSYVPRVKKRQTITWHLSFLRELVCFCTPALCMIPLFHVDVKYENTPCASANVKWRSSSVVRPKAILAMRLMLKQQIYRQKGSTKISHPMQRKYVTSTSHKPMLHIGVTETSIKRVTEVVTECFLDYVTRRARKSVKRWCYIALPTNFATWK